MAFMQNLQEVKSMIAVIVLLIVVLAIVIANVRIVPQAEAYVIERLGRYKMTWGAGLHLKTPFIERIARRARFPVFRIWRPRLFVISSVRWNWTRP